MENIIISLDKISNADIGGIAYCLENNPRINSYEIIPEDNSIVIHMKYDFEITKVSSDLTSHGYKIITATIQRGKNYIPLLEALVDKEAIEQEVLRENANFNLEKFFTDELDGAICVITKNKTIFANAVLNHYTALNSIYNLLYNNSDEMKEYQYDEGSSWQESAVSFGNVVIQLCSNVSNTAWLPEQMNTYQKLKLKKILDQINTINKKLNVPINIEVGKPSDFERQSAIKL